MEEKLEGSLREGYKLYPTSDYDVTLKTNPTSDPSRFNTVVTLSAFGITSEELPFEMWADGKGKKYEDLHAKCLLSDSEQVRIAQRFKDKAQLAARGVPLWVYGTWSITTPYGTETMKLEESGTIIDMIGKDMQVGTFTYQDGELQVRFPENKGMVFTYELDMEGHRISIGEGQFMHKRH